MSRSTLTMWLSLIALTAAASPDAGVPAPSRAASPPAFLSVPQELARTDVPAGTRALGVPVKLSAVVSKLSVPELDAHFHHAFAKAGLFVPTDDELDNPSPLQHVTGLDVESNTSYSVLFQPNGDGTTTVLVGTAALHARTQTDQPFAPVFPAASGLLLSDAEAGRMLTYSAPAKAKDVWAFYKDTLTRAGFTSRESGTFETATTSLQVWVTERGDHSSVVVLGRTR